MQLGAIRAVCATVPRVRDTAIELGRSELEILRASRGMLPCANGPNMETMTSRWHVYGLIRDVRYTYLEVDCGHDLTSPSCGAQADVTAAILAHMAAHPIDL